LCEGKGYWAPEEQRYYDLPSLDAKDKVIDRVLEIGLEQLEIARMSQGPEVTIVPAEAPEDALPTGWRWRLNLALRKTPWRLYPTAREVERKKGFGKASQRKALPDVIAAIKALCDVRSAEAEKAKEEKGVVSPEPEPEESQVLTEEAFYANLDAIKRKSKPQSGRHPLGLLPGDGVSIFK
jgi:hypothetical protein